MELYLKKYFWVVHVLVLGTCALLLARGVNRVIEAKYLIGSANGQTHPGSARLHKPAATVAPAPTTPTKDVQAVVNRNIFCSTCEPPVPVASAQTLPGDPNNPPPTSLPLVLMATSVARDEALSSATISNTQLNKAGSYWLNEDIPGAGTIVKIQPRFVDFKNRSANRVERLDLSGAAPAHPPPAAPPPVAAAPPAPGSPDEFIASVDKGVRKIDETHYEIDRSLVDKVLGDPNLVARAARIVPSIKDGKSNGFKMYAIRPNSVYAKIGFQNGDTIHSINGFEMTSPDKALEVYTKVKSASSLSIQMTRRGQPLTMEYGIK